MEIIKIICGVLVLLLVIIMQTRVIYQNRVRSMGNRERLERLEERVTHLETQANKKTDTT